jgi:hypothetical protein
MGRGDLRVTEHDEPRLCPLTHRADPDRPRKSAPSSVLCYGHIQQAYTALDDLPGRYDELGTVAAPTYEQRTGARSAEKPIPYRESAAEHRTLIRGTLVAWSLLVQEERGLTAGATSPEPARTCEFLRRHHEWSVAQLWADDYATELRDLAERAWSILHPRGVREFTSDVMRCVEDLDSGQRCSGHMWAVLRNQQDLLPSELECDVCGHAVSADKWMTYGRKVREVVEQEQKGAA